MNAFYTVYRKPNDTPVAIHKNRIQCAAAMGLTLSSFDSIASRNLTGKNVSKKWDIIRHVEGKDDE